MTTKTQFKSNIIIQESVKKLVKVNRPDLKKRIEFILSMMCDFSTEISIQFCDEAEMTQMNFMFRKKNKPTDVLSFPNTMMVPEIKTKYAYLGDISICLPVCIKQAKTAKVTLSQELEKMVIHAIVHLKGFDHERGSAAFRVMSNLEEALQNELVSKLKKPTWCILSGAAS